MVHYPQNPAEDSVWTKDFGLYNEEQKEYLRGSLGNLLLLSVSKNSSLQNDEYVDKKNGRKNDDGEDVYKGYCRGSHSETDVASKYDVWNAQNILARGMDILSFMEKRWNNKFVDEKSKRAVLFLDFI